MPGMVLSKHKRYDFDNQDDIAHLFIANIYTISFF